MKKLGCLLCFIGILSAPMAQWKKYKICIVAFYNLENLYDTLNNSMVNDEEFQAEGDKQYTPAIYINKLGRLAATIAQIGTDHTPEGPALLGVAEVENDTVLNDLVRHPALLHKNYHFIHFDSKDLRGVDVALLYDPRFFRPLFSEVLTVPLPEHSKEARFTRDILYVTGMLDGEPVHIYVNHWPSRRGGERRSIPARKAAASVCRKHLDRMLQVEPNAKLIVMGDLNDNPVDLSITDVLQAKGASAKLLKSDLYNPWTALYLLGHGTLAHRDSWGLFDQIILSQSWLPKQQTGFFLHAAYIFQRPYMIEQSGRFKGYAMRTWEGNHYRGGFSDHFPTYLVLLKKTL